MVELPRVLSVANFYHKLSAGTLKQLWFASYGSILRTVTAFYENIQDNCTRLAMPEQLCHTICAIPPVYNTVLTALRQNTLIKS